MPEVLTQQQNVNAAFSKQAVVFDDIDKGNPIIQWMRIKVRQHVLSFWKADEHILELNAGTGLDAAFFASKGLFVHATDDAEGMVNELKKKESAQITSEHCSFLELNKIQKHDFDHIFSNFGGLNCTGKLDEVIKSFSDLLKPGGTVTLVIMPTVCPWEMLSALKGNFKLAFRRLRKGGVTSNVEGVTFKSYYYSPSKVIRMFGKGYKTISLEGLGAIVPPPYKGEWAINYPRVFKAFTSLENSVADAWPFCSWADHFIITMQKLA